MLFITKWKIPKEQSVLVFLICCSPSFEKFVTKVFKYKIMDFQFNSIENRVILSVNIYLAHDAKNGFFNEKKNGKIIKEDEKTWYFIENCGDTKSQKTRPLEYRTFNNNLLIKSNLQQQKSRPMPLCHITSLRIRWQIALDFFFVGFNNSAIKIWRTHIWEMGNQIWISEPQIISPKPIYWLLLINLVTTNQINAKI